MKDEAERRVKLPWKINKTRSTTYGIKIPARTLDGEQAAAESFPAGGTDTDVKTLPLLFLYHMYICSSYNKTFVFFFFCFFSSEST